MNRTPVRYTRKVAGRCVNSPGRGHPRLDGGNVTDANRKRRRAPHPCACGCGDHPAGWTAKYIRGHRPPLQWDQFLENFWSKVDVQGPDDCWEWQGAVGEAGHGQTWWNGRQQQAHRMSMVIAGRDPGDLWGLHLCDNPPCVNPAHLYAGTATDNARDVNIRGEWNHHKGERHYYAKLTDEEVREIRDLYEQGHPRRAIAERFGITTQYVWQLGTRRWRETA